MKGLSSLTLQKFTFNIYVCESVFCMFYVCVGIGFVNWLKKGFIYFEGDILKHVFAYDQVWSFWGDPVQLTGYENPVTINIILT